MFSAFAFAFTFTLASFACGSKPTVVPVSESATNPVSQLPIPKDSPAIHLVTKTDNDNVIEISVVGRKWTWDFSYGSGDREFSADELHVPVGRVVHLSLQSEDVLHAFAIAEFGAKVDVIPGRTTSLTFQADQIGKYSFACDEYCGKFHTEMRGTLYVDSRAQYEEWLRRMNEKYGDDCRDFSEPKQYNCLVRQGEQVYATYGCKQCHSIDGSKGIGPTFAAIWGANRSFSDGSVGTVDKDYIRESVRTPMAKIHIGFRPIMPAFAKKLEDRHLAALIKWMQQL